MPDPFTPPEDEESPAPGRFQIHDMGAALAGKYQVCTRWNGLLYADSDFGADGRPKAGALPAPVQGSLEADVLAAALIEAHAVRITAEALERARGRQRPAHRRRWLDRLRRLFR